MMIHNKTSLFIYFLVWIRIQIYIRDLINQINFHYLNQKFPPDENPFLLSIRFFLNEKIENLI